MSDNERPIINCHTHIFKGEHVPPYLAKTFIPWPLYRILTVPFILWIFKTFINKKRAEFKDPQVEQRRNKVKRKIAFQRNIVLRIIKGAIKVAITIHALFIVLAWLRVDEEYEIIHQIRTWLNEHYLLWNIKSLPLQILLVAIVVLFVKSGRNLLWFIAKKSLKFLSLLPGKMTRDLIGRYVLLGRFAIYEDQSTTFSKLIQQYEPGSKFVVLPMDMEYMGAGPLKKGSLYKDQMAELARIKKESTNKDAFLPFVFVEPRRMTEDKGHFQYDFEEASGKINLKDCFIKEYIEDKKFSGFKMYPALGYYPFDEVLLPLWLYAAEHQIPIMTHCIVGTIFYRGKKIKAWDEHPIFKEYINLKNKETGLLLLPEWKNKDFCTNFTHPLNYLVLLEEELLRVWVGQGTETTKNLFGYTDGKTKLKRDLSQLKICLAHFGGEDQWEKYLEYDRYDYAQELIKNPTKGIDFIHTKTGNFSWKKLEDCWKYVDWYSIICSMLIRYDNVYADISYILHNQEIFPLLRQTINNPELGDKVLFGTDFFVVRNHSSEKGLVSDTSSQLTTEEFDKIAKINPQNYLKRT
ncbi:MULTISPECIES: amidohydrolase family protein [Flavobacteriaceae]|uniref:amidohydrolase family protein n=1 Tax=Flavobacteriaceae TaxID=49546 RepID=UPI00149228E9|nr:MULTISPECIES: amidohydrolase family protein [Allomuricauda]MDC6366655.1 amidohydrolase family protein [Muricauda sp. AC10]